MTTTKEFASKLSVAIVAIAMVFSAFASTASAQTTEELQAMINDLLAQVAALQATTSGTNVGGTCTSIMAPLTIGSRGGDVMALQNYLMSAGYSIPAGPTDYFGGQTQAALAQWQAANGVSPAVGYYGPITKAAIDAKCVVAADEDMDEDMDEDDDSSDVTLSGEASLDVFEIDSADEDQIEEGAEDAPIAELTVEFVDGDAEISRIDFQILGDGETDTSAVEPWEAFEEISLWVDGDKVASMNADDEDDYLDEDEGTFRFSNLDLVAMEDEEMVITVAVTVQNSLDTDELVTWTVSAEEMRFFDADGVATTEDNVDEMGDTVDFSIEEAGFDDELLIKTSSNDPDATTLQVEDNSKSDWYTVFVFDLDTDDSINDIEINTVAFEVTTVGASVSSILSDVEITIDGESFDDWEYTTGTSASTTRVIEVDVDGDHTIDAGDREEVEVMLEFKSANGTNYTSGATVSLATVDTAFDAEGADDVVADGAASSDTHTLLTEGIDTEMTDSSAVVTVGDGTADDYATFEIEVEVTAFEQDVYIPTDASTIAAVIVTNTGTTSAATVVLDSSADETNDRFEINEGETETITLTVTYGPGVAGDIVRLRLNSIGFYDLATGGTLTTQTTLPASDYRTAQVTIVN